MDRISVVINTIIEEENIERAIKSAKRFADEVVVVDMHSDDSTVKIAKKAGARVYSHERTGYVEPARNFAIEKAHGDWVFILDADEEVPLALGNKIRKVVENPSADYFAVSRRNIIFGKWMKHSRWWPDYNIRFFKKGKVAWDNHIHSVPITKGKGLDLPAEKKYAIKHYHYISIEQYIDRMNRYTSVQAREKYLEGTDFNWHDLLKKPTAEFISRYFAGKGYKDGVHGLAVACLQALSESVLYMKLWQYSKFKQQKLNTREVVLELKHSQAEMNYWTADTLVKEGAGTLQKFKRKFRLP